MIKRNSILALLLVAMPAFAQLDGGGDFDPEVEKFEADEGAAAQEIKNEVEKSGPAPGTLDKPKSAGVKSSRNPYSNDKIFDWSKYEGETEVPHPFAQKGLLRITREKMYIYKVDETEQKTAAQIRFAQYSPLNLEAKHDNGTVATFVDNYDQADNPALLLDWEWQLWRSPIGKWAVSFGGGAYIAQGNGHFAGTKNAQNGLTPREIFTFVTVPWDLGLVYRMQIWHRQLFVPYGTAGGTAFTFGEFRDDNKAPKWGGAFGAFYAAGLAMNLSYFDAISRIQLDREYGINAVYLTAEYRGVAGFGNFDFSSDMANAGFLMEY